MNKDVKAKLFEKPLNKSCFDCSIENPEWASVNNSVFLCKECQVKHRTYGISISYIRSLEMDMWKEDQIGMLKLGGNERLRDLMSLYNIKFNTNRSELYNSKLLDYYRKLLKSELRGDQRPHPPSDEEALLPIEKTDKVKPEINNNNSNINYPQVNINHMNNDIEDSNINISNENQSNSNSNNNDLKGTVTGFLGGLWSTTKDVASAVKNKVDESGIAETVKQKASVLTEKVVEGTQYVAHKGVEYGKKGIDYTHHKYDEVVSNIT